MKRPLIAWTIFSAGMAVALAVMLFFTIRLLSFERSIADAQAHAALEDTVRLALWRIDSAAPVLLHEQAAQQQRQIVLMSNSNRHISQVDAPQLYDPQYQNAISANEAQLRKTLEPADGVDWQKFAPQLLDRIRDILPGASLEPSAPAAKHEADTRQLATIPARLVVPASALPNSALPWNTPARISLMVAWAFAVLTAAAIARLLFSTLSLSQRRGAFASAVTHELRTPLTTFRMYAEMLATGMVSDEPKRREYLATLVAESDRLGNLIENVLAYSRLENRLAPQRLAEIQTVQRLVDHAEPLLRRRADQAGLPLTVNLTNPAATSRTDPVAVGQILMNLVDNACKYGRSAIELTASSANGCLEFRVRDQGPGIAARQAARLFQPFSKSKTDPIPGIGLGLFVSRQLARALGGSLEYRPADLGAEFVLTIPASHF